MFCHSWFVLTFLAFISCHISCCIVIIRFILISVWCCVSIQSVCYSFTAIKWSIPPSFFSFLQHFQMSSIILCKSVVMRYAWNKSEGISIKITYSINHTLYFIFYSTDIQKERSYKIERIRNGVKSQRKECKTYKICFRRKRWEMRGMEKLS